MKKDDDQKFEWDELEFEEADRTKDDPAKGRSMEDQINEVIQKLGQDEPEFEKTDLTEDGSAEDRSVEDQINEAIQKLGQDEPEFEKTDLTEDSSAEDRSVEDQVDEAVRKLGQDELEVEETDLTEDDSAKDRSVEDRVDEAVQKLVRQTMGDIPRNMSGSEAEKDTETDDFEEEPEEEEYYEEEEYDDEEDGRPRRKKGGRKFLIFGLAAAFVLVLLSGFYGYRAFYFTNHFFDGTTINGMDCSGMTAEEVEQKIAADAGAYVLDISFRNGEQQIEGSSIDYRYQPDGSMKKLLKQQNVLAWPMENSKNSKHETNVKMQYDERKLDEQTSQFQQFQEDQMQMPSSAQLQFQNGQFIVTEENKGTHLDVEKAKNAISEALASGSTELDMEQAGVYTEPESEAEEEDLEAQAAQLNDLVSASITYQLPDGKTQVLDGTVLKDWLSVDENGSYSKNDEIWNQKLNEYVANLAATVDTYGKEQTFPATGIEGGVKVTQPDYGWQIDQAQEAAQLAQDIENHLTTTREPVYASRAFAADNNGFGNTYVEIDISRQHIWFYKDGELLVDSSCVTGKMVKSRYTPGGIFKLVSKTSPKTLRGPKKADGTYEWESDVTYWMPFNGGIGLHDATWRSSFGGSIYKNSGSHGCVNLPFNVAKKIYNNIDVGTPIIVYYSEDYTVRDDTAEREAENLPSSAIVEPETTPEPEPSDPPATETPEPEPSDPATPSNPPATETPDPEPSNPPATETPDPEPSDPPVTETPEPSDPPVTETPEPSDPPATETPDPGNPPAEETPGNEEPDTPAAEGDGASGNPAGGEASPSPEADM